MAPKTLLIVAHQPSENTRRLAAAALRGAESAEVSGVRALLRRPLDTGPEEVLAADGVLLGTTENLGYMSGALKDFFDRVYYPCLEKTEALPYALYVRAGHDGTGTCRAVESITTGLRWKAVREPLVCRGDWREGFERDCEELGTLLAAGLELGVF